MAIIAMTQHIGTRAFELGRLTAESLGYRFLTADQIIAQASAPQGPWCALCGWLQEGVWKDIAWSKAINF